MDFTEFKKRHQKKIVQEVPIKVCQQPLVSVCVQTFQHKNFIKECLDGILMQKTNFRVEILLGDDESNDGTREICLNYAEEHPDKIRLFLHHRENNIYINGKATGRFNFLNNLYCAEGKYIAFCEGDDYWTDPFKLQKQVEFLEKNANYIACVHNSYFSDESKRKIITKIFSNLRTGQVQLKDICPTRSFHTASLLFRQDAFKNMDLKFFGDKVISGDKFLFMHFWLTGNIFYDQTPMAVYRRNAGGMSKSKNLNRFMDADIKMYDYFKKRVPEEYKGELEEAKNYFKVNRFNYALENNKNYRLLSYYLALIPIAGNSKHLPHFKFKKATKAFLNKILLANG